MKIKSLYIENFQSIKRLRLNFRENEFLGIMGENNVGKTSIIRAINLLATAAETRHVKKHYVRKGAKNLTIVLETYEGDKITLVRGKDNYYLIQDKDGNIEEYPSNANSRVPERVLEILDLFVDVETKQTYNIVTGANKLPLFSSTPSANYKLMQKILRLDEVNDAMQKMKEDIAKIDSELTMVQLSAESVKQQIEEIDKELEDEIILENQLTFLEKQKKNLYALDKYIDLNEQLTELKKGYTPVLLDKEALFKLGKSISNLEKLEKIIRLSEQISELEKSKVKVDKPSNELITKLENDLKVCEKLESYLKKYKELRDLNKSLIKIEKPNVDLSVVEKLEKLLLNVKQKKSLVQELKIAQEELQELINKREGIYKQMGYCPYCGSTKN